jgi:hypothetical protein
MNRVDLLNENAGRGLTDLYFFLTHYWGLDLEEQPHREMVSAIQSAEVNDEKPYCAMIVPRGTYKSSIAIGAMVWKLLRHVYIYHNPYHRIAFASATLALGRRAINTIAGMLKKGGHEGRIAKDYGELWLDHNKNQQGSKLAGGDGINIKPKLDQGESASSPEPNIWLASQRRISTGWHADELYCDDLHDEKTVKTSHQREEAKRFYRLLIPILMPKDKTGRIARRTFNATRWHEDDVPGMILREVEEKRAVDPMYPSRWTFVEHGCFTEVGANEGTLYFPSVLTNEVLEERLDDLGPRLFSCNYLNYPLGNTGFADEDKIKFIPRKNFPPLSKIRAALDPNQHTKAMELGCWAAIVIVGYDRFANLYVLDARGSREWDTADTVDALFEIEEMYPEISFYIENEHMAAFETYLRMQQAERGKRLRVHWTDVPRNKTYEDRWIRLQPRFRRSQIFFAEEIELHVKRELKDELVRGSAARFGDFLDALAISDTGIRPKIDKTGAQIPTEQPQSTTDERVNSVPTFLSMLSKEQQRKVLASAKAKEN